jgi:hypothetical protein
MAAMTYVFSPLIGPQKLYKGIPANQRHPLDLLRQSELDFILPPYKTIKCNAQPTSYAYFSRSNFDLDLFHRVPLSWVHLVSPNSMRNSASVVRREVGRLLAGGRLGRRT